MDDSTLNDTPEVRRNGPGMGHFYVLLALIVVMLGGIGYLFYALRGEDDSLRTQLNEASDSLAATQDKQGKALGAQLADLEVNVEKSAKKLDGLAADLDKLRKDFIEYRSGTDGRLADLTKADEELAQTLKTRTDELATQIELARAELAKEQEGIKGVITQIQDDSKYIISELGKKAEKAYMRFMERKLKKQITAVEDKVETVKGELDQRITDTQTQIATALGQVGETIKKKVEEHVKIDFVPSATDEE
jgi:tetrahydromethanopterin S-methyltransferase subunit G